MGDGWKQKVLICLSASLHPHRDAEPSRAGWATVVSHGVGSSPGTSLDRHPRRPQRAATGSYAALGMPTSLPGTHQNVGEHWNICMGCFDSTGSGFFFSPPKQKCSSRKNSAACRNCMKPFHTREDFRLTVVLVHSALDTETGHSYNNMVKDNRWNRPGAVLQVLL